MTMSGFCIQVLMQKPEKISPPNSHTIHKLASVTHTLPQQNWLHQNLVQRRLKKSVFSLSLHHRPQTMVKRPSSLSLYLSLTLRKHQTNIQQSREESTVPKLLWHDVQKVQKSQKQGWKTQNLEALGTKLAPWHMMLNHHADVAFDTTFKFWLWKKNLQDKEKNLASKNHLHKKLLSFHEEKNTKFNIQEGQCKMEKLTSQHATRHASSGRTI